MTIRDAIEDLLAARGHGADPAEVLGQHGFGDLPPEALSSALLHFAEGASLPVADALAPLVTRVSPVPFTEDDLPPSEEASAILADGGDVYDLLGGLDLTPVESLDHDSDDLDLFNDFNGEVGFGSEEPAPTDDTELATADNDDHAFGDGDVANDGFDHGTQPDLHDPLDDGQPDFYNVDPDAQPDLDVVDQGAQPDLEDFGRHVPAIEVDESEHDFDTEAEDFDLD